MSSLIHKIKSINPIIIIIVIFLIIRVWGINHGFPDVNRYFYDTEENPSIQIAMGFGSGDLNPHSFNKPSLYFYLLFVCYVIFYALGSMVGFFSGITNFIQFYFSNTWIFYLIARLLSTVFGVASIYFIYLIGKKMFNYKTALIASLMLAVTPIHIEFSQLALSDILGLFLAVVSVYYAILAYDSFKFKNILLSTFFAGLSMSAKYHYGFVILAFFAVILMLIFRDKLLKLLYLKAAFSGIFFFLCGFIIGTPFAVLDYKYFFVS